MKLSTDDIRGITELLLKNLDDTGRSEFEIDEDHYWWIEEEDLYQYTGLFDTLDGSRTGTIRYETDWTGPVVDFVNSIRSERDLPTRSAYMVDPASRSRIIVYFNNVIDRRPSRVFTVKRRE